MKRPFDWIRRTVRKWTWWDVASALVGVIVGLLISIPWVR